MQAEVLGCGGVWADSRHSGIYVSQLAGWDQRVSSGDAPTGCTQKEFDPPSGRFEPPQWTHTSHHSGSERQWFLSSAHTRTTSMRV